jgi:hypothetical protein
VLYLRVVLAACCLVALHATPVDAQRSFAPGVLKLVKPEIDGRDVHSLPMPLPGVSPEYLNEAAQTDWNYVDDTKTLLGQTRRVVFYRDVWQHEFAHLGLRQLNVVASNLSGELRDRNIWYLVFRVRNVGANVSHEAVEDRFGHVDFEPRLNVQQIDSTTLPDRFFPTFRLSGWVQDPQTGTYREINYAD